MGPTVLFTSPFFLPFVRRGTENEIHDVGEALLDQGLDISLLTTKPRWWSTAREAARFPVTYEWANLTRAKESEGWDHASLIHEVVAAHIETAEVDLVHCWHYADAAAAAHRRPDVPMVLKLTGTVLPDRIRQRKPFQHDLLMRALQTADQVWCNSEYAQRSMAGFGVDMHVVPAGTSFGPLGLERWDQPTALIASSADDPRKRIAEVVAAWPAVVDAIPDARLLVVGEANKQTQSALRAGISSHQQGSIVFCGVQPHSALPDYFARSWVSLSPAVHEALGLVTIEALAHGTQVIGADSGATSDLVRGLGILVEPGDLAGWSSALITALSAKPAGDDPRCVERVAAYSWDRVVPTYLDRYRALLRS